MIPAELIPFLELHTQRLRNLGVAAAVGFGLLSILCVVFAVLAITSDLPAFVVTSCKGNEACLARHRQDEVVKALVLLVLVGIPTLIGIVVWARNRSFVNTPLAKALSTGGTGLRAVYPRKTTVTAAGARVGDFYEIVFERAKGEPWKWLVNPEQIAGVMAALRRSVPKVFTERA